VIKLALRGEPRVKGKKKKKKMMLKSAWQVPRLSCQVCPQDLARKVCKKCGKIGGNETQEAGRKYLSDISSKSEL